MHSGRGSLGAGPFGENFGLEGPSQAVDRIGGAVVRAIRHESEPRRRRCKEYRSRRASAAIGSSDKSCPRRAGRGRHTPVRSRVPPAAASSNRHRSPPRENGRKAREGGERAAVLDCGIAATRNVADRSRRSHARREAAPPAARLRRHHQASAQSRSLRRPRASRNGRCAAGGRPKAEAGARIGCQRKQFSGATKHRPAPVVIRSMRASTMPSQQAR